MGESGRRRACEHFAWHHVIRMYEELWLDQETQRSAMAGTGSSSPRGPWGPAAYPDPERTFAAYPTRWLDTAGLIAPAHGELEMVDGLLAMPLAHHAAGGRVADPALLRAAFALLPCSVEDLDRFWSQSGIDRGVGRATLAWLLKYDLVRISHPTNTSPPEGANLEANPD